jgi:hypothetical protein
MDFIRPEKFFLRSFRPIRQPFGVLGLIGGGTLEPERKGIQGSFFLGQANLEARRPVNESATTFCQERFEVACAELLKSGCDIADVEVRHDEEAVSVRRYSKPRRSHENAFDPCHNRAAGRPARRRFPTKRGFIPSGIAKRWQTHTPTLEVEDRLSQRVILPAHNTG